MMSLFNTLIHKESLSRIDHKFLVREHTYLPNHRDFGHISKRKIGSISYAPSHYIEFLRNARPLKPFTVIKMKAEPYEWKLLRITNFADSRFLDFRSKYFCRKRLLHVLLVCFTISAEIKFRG